MFTWELTADIEAQQQAKVEGYDPKQDIHGYLKRCQELKEKIQASKNETK